MLKYIIGVAVAVCLISLWALTTSTDSEKEATASDLKAYEGSVVVLELFTSQGCSSCPPADELLGRIRQERKPGIFTLSYHVDYWNYIGWEDPFSKPEYTDRQRAYNLKFGSRSNYTPQLVVNGREHFVGSDSRKVYRKISEYGRIPAENQIAISRLESEGGKLNFSFKVSGPLEGKTLNSLLVIDERTTSVIRGENRNRNLTNFNVVLESKEMSLKNESGKMSIQIPDLLTDSDKFRLIVLVENSEAEITGAGSSELIQL